MNQNWDDLRIFLAVARTGQLVAAARSLGVNHATASRRMDQLEAALGTKLIYRRTRGCTLTEEGERLLAAAEAIESTLNNATDQIGGDSSAPKGTVRVGAPDGFGLYFLAPKLGELHDLYPQLALELVPISRNFAVSRREADIVITTERPTQNSVVAKRLVEYELGLYASTSYLARSSAIAHIEDLQHHRLVGYVDDLLFSASLDYTREFYRHWRNDISVASAVGQMNAVVGGAGVGILHQYIAHDVPQLQRVLPSVAVKRTYWLTYHEEMRPIQRVQSVVKFIEEAVERALPTFSSN